MKRKLEFLTAIMIAFGSFLISMRVSAHLDFSTLSQQPSGGTCDELQVVFIVDQSGSMSTSVAGAPSDPDGLRFYGPSRAVETLSSLRYQTYQTATMRVAMVHFGDSPELGMPWTILDPTTSEEHQQLQDELAPYFAPISSLGNTDVLRAFQTTSSLFDQVPPQVGECPARVVILITDGKPSIPRENFSWIYHMEELADYVSSYMPPPGHQIHVIGIDQANNYWNEVKPYWDTVTGDPTKVVKAEDQAHMASIILDIVESAVSVLQVTGSQADSQCVSGGTLAVPPFVQELKLTLIKPAPNLHLDVLDEKGHKLDPSRGDITVIIDGYDEPIETLTVLNPQPGMWNIQTVLPAGTQDRCNIRMLAFRAVANLVKPDLNSGGMPVQFQRLPISLKIVDTAGGSLPEYSDPNYALNVEMNLIVPFGESQPLLLDNQPDYVYTGETIPIESGSNTLQGRGVSHYPDGSEYVVFDKPVATFQVAAVRLVMLQGPSGVVAQYREMPLEFALVAEQQNVRVDLPLVFSATMMSEVETVPLELTVNQTGTYETIFKPEQTSRHTLVYAAQIETPQGYVSIGQEQVEFEVFPTTLVRAEIVSDERLVATDALLRKTGIPIEIQLVDEQGNEVSPGEIGAANPMVVFGARVLDSKKNDRSDEVQITNTGKPGLFRLTSDTLGPGKYDVTIVPATELGRDYTWAADSWTGTVRGTINPLFFALLGSVLVVVGSGTGMLITGIRRRKHPLSGYIEIFQEMPALDGDTHRKSVLKRYLPIKRNRVVLTASTGLASLIEQLLPVSLSKDAPIKRMLITCPTEADSQAGRARVEIKLKSGGEQTVVLDPSQPPVLLNLDFFIEKGPRKDIISKGRNFTEPPDNF